MKKREMKIRFLEHEKDHFGFAQASTEGGKGCYHNLFKQFLVEDTGSFGEFIRMNRNHFQFRVRKYGTIYTRKKPKRVKV